MVEAIQNPVERLRRLTSRGSAYRRSIPGHLVPPEPPSRDWRAQHDMVVDATVTAGTPRQRVQRPLVFYENKRLITGRQSAGGDQLFLDHQFGVLGTNPYSSETNPEVRIQFGPRGISGDRLDALMRYNLAIRRISYVAVPIIDWVVICERFIKDIPGKNNRYQVDKRMRILRDSLDVVADYYGQ